MDIKDYITLSIAKMPDSMKVMLLQKYGEKFKINDIVYINEENKCRNEKYNKYIQNLKDYQDEELIQKMITYMKNNRIKLTSIIDEDYPEKLKNLDNPPPFLYYKGNIDILTQRVCVSIVGARKCTHEGEDIAKSIAKELAKEGITIVSGLAKGIDGNAHEGALSVGGNTCGILGAGINEIYPKRNRGLYEKMSEEGCIISEFPIGTPPLRHNFPQRNRIISALSDLLIVVEAGERSGALNTATHALAIGKDVMAIPGSVFSEASKGSNKLLRDGAYVFTEMEDVFQILGIDKKEMSKSKKDDIPKEYIEIYNVLSNQPMHIDEIVSQTCIDIGELYSILFELQINNTIKCIDNNYYVKIKNCV